VSAPDIVKLILTGGIVLTVFAIGLRSTPDDTLLLVRNPRLGVRAMTSMFVLMPIFVIALTMSVALGRPDRAALIALAVSPMPPILPRRQATVGGSGNYDIGLQVLGSVVCIVVAPTVAWLAGRLFNAPAVFDTVGMLRVLAVTIGLPLAAGILIARFWPRAKTFSNRLGVFAMVLLAVGGAFALYAEGPKVLARIGHGALWVTAAIVLFGLLVGHLLGGPDPGNRGALALATSARHPGLAIALAAGAFPTDKDDIVATVLLFLMTNLLLTLPYMLWRRRLMAHAKTAS
jgi:bile acid:Na+ symporter, BASS family